jgi:hypothetical protein
MPMTTRTTIRWTDREYNELKRFADDHSITLSAAVRRVMLKHIQSAIAQRQTPWLY